MEVRNSNCRTRELFDYLSEFMAQSVEESVSGQFCVERRSFEPNYARDFLLL